MSKEAMKLALEALEANSLLVNGNDEKWGLVWCMDGYYSVCFDIDSINKQTNEAITALREALANEALDKMAENARELGLDYEPAQYSDIVSDGGFDPRNKFDKPEQCNHHFVRDEEAVKHYCCQKCGTVKVEQPAPVAKPHEQEPVAWKHDCAALLTNDVELWIDHCPHCGKPRTSPPQRKPLTDEEWQSIADTLDCSITRGQKDAIEAALGIKENT